MGVCQADKLLKLRDKMDTERNVQKLTVTDWKSEGEL